MKIKYIARMALDKIIFYKKSFLFMMILLCMGLFSIGVVLVGQMMNSYARDICDRTLAKGIERTGTVRVNDNSYFSQESKEFLQEAEAADIIYSIGYVMEGKMADGYLSELAEIQSGFPDIDTGSEALTCIFMNRTAIKLCNLSFQEVQEIDEDKWNSGRWFGIYLGANFKGIPVGTQYVEEVRGEEWVYEVMGILDENSRFVSGAVLFTAAGNGFNTCTRLDSMVICIGNTMPNSAGWAYSPEDGVTMEEAREYLAELAEKYELPVSFASLSAGFAYDDRERTRINNVLIEIFSLICLVTLLIDVCIFFITFLNNMEEYGIIYAMGVSKRGLLGILLMENLLKCLLAFMFTWGILYAYIWTNVGGDQTIRYALNDVMYHGVIQKLFLIDVLSIILLTAVPALVLSYSKPVTLLRGTRT